MKSSIFALLSAFLLSTMMAHSSLAQLQVDTLAFQDFETVPASPVWSYTGTLAGTQSGFAPANASIPNTPLGINGSQAWHVAQVSAGNPIVFNNTVIPVGYDSIRVNFRLSAMNLLAATGGPDNLDYVLVAYSLDNGATFVDRLRIRGSVLDNSFWAYDATGVASVNYLPATETVIQPLSSIGLQVAEGYSFCEITFPGSISQLAIRITPRSSSSTDSWLVDNLVLSGEFNCSPVTSSIVESVCGSYTSPSGNTYFSSGIFTDTLAAASGCDSIITIDLTVNPITATSISETACDSYTAPSGAVYTTSGTYDDFLTSSAGCDSTITIALTVNTSSSSSISATGLDVYTAPSGATYTSSGIYTDIIPNAAGCDSVITIDLTMSFTGLEEETAARFSISPNPTTGHIFLQTDEQIEAIRVFSSQGKLVYSTSEATFSVEQLDAGVYRVVLETEGSVSVGRFVKM